MVHGMREPRTKSGALVRAVSLPVRRAKLLEIATIVWNLLEVFVTIGLGIAAGSLALIAFGLDSIAEILASGAVLWHLRGGVDAARSRRALRLVAVAFFALGGVLLIGGIRNLAVEQRPDDSPFGIAYLAMTACVMLGLAFAKRRLGTTVESHPLVHETRVTFLDGILATSVLLALVANSAFGWWWADPIAVVGVAVVAIFEGVAALREHASRRSAGAIQLDAIVGTVRIDGDVEFDPGGIGKGLAADLVVEELLAGGAKGAMVSIGGDLRAEGAGPEGSGWVIAVADPSAPDRVIATLAFEAGAVASTWRTKRAWLAPDGTSRHHLIDPRTGESAATGLAGVTVVAGRAWRAEVLAKAAFLAGGHEGNSLLACHGAAALLVADDGTIQQSGDLAPFVLEERGEQ